MILRKSIWSFPCLAQTIEIPLKFKCKYNVKRKVHPSEVVNKFKCKYKNYTRTLGWVSTLWGCGAMWFWL